MTEQKTSPTHPASPPSAPQQLTGRMGVVELALTVVAFAAPLASVVGVLPLVILFGGIGAPLAFVTAMAMLLLFSVGYTTMSRYLPNPGAFYAYISAGINKTVGLSAALSAILGYLMVGLGISIFFGIVAQGMIVDTFNGPSIAWWALSLALVAAVGVFGFYRIDLSAKVLSVVMVLEIAIVLVFDVAVAADGGPEGRSLSPFALTSFTDNAVGVSILFAVITFLGFEATAVFREESREPAKTIPRATYLAVALIGTFYVVTTWLMIVAVGTSKAPAVAADNAPAMFTESMTTYVGGWAGDVVSTLVVTSSFAAVLSCQNIVARYCHSLGTDEAFPKLFGRVHPQHGSPHMSSIILTGVFALGIIVFAGSDPAVTYAWMAGAGGFPLLVLMFLTSVAVVLFFRKSQAEIADASTWRTAIAPVLAAIGLGFALYLAAINFVPLTGGNKTTAVVLQIVIWSVFALGLALATTYRVKRPDIYARIGRQQVG